MDSRHFDVAYVVTKNGFDWIFPLAPFVMFVASLILLKRQKNDLRRGMTVAFCIVTALIFVAISILFVSNYISGTSEYRRGHYSLIEGAVTDFKPLPQWVHRGQGVLQESFSVNGITFSYYDSSVAAATCFRHSPWGDPISEGRYVRIAYDGNCILRLEVASDGSH